MKKVKRGRPNKRMAMQNQIIEVLSSFKTPMTTTSITKYISQKTNKAISWNTTEKYIQELVKLDKIQAIKLPHSKQEGKEGLTVYILKR